MKKSKLLTIVPLLLSFNAFAEKGPYSYLEIDYSSMVFDSPVVSSGVKMESLNGLEGTGSFQVSKNFALEGGLSVRFDESTGSGIVFETTESIFYIKPILILPVNDILDINLYGSLGKQKIEVCGSNGFNSVCLDTDIDQKKLGVAFRASVSDSFEINGDIGRLKSEANNSSDTEIIKTDATTNLK